MYGSYTPHPAQGAWDRGAPQGPKLGSAVSLAANYYRPWEKPERNTPLLRRPRCGITCISSMHRRR